MWWRRAISILAIEQDGSATRSRNADILPYAWSTAFVALARLRNDPRRVLAVQSVALVFLTAVLASAITYGLWPALYTSMISMLTFNFFFLPPLYTFTIAEPENVVALFFFLVVAFIASNLTARVRSQSWRASAPRPPRTSICSAASWPASAPSTMCCGPPLSRSHRC